MNVLIQQDPYKEYGPLHPANGYPWVWAVLGEDERVPHAAGRAKTYEDALAAAEMAQDAPATNRYKHESAVYPTRTGWRWILWRGAYRARPILGGVAESAQAADRLTFYASYHTYRPWGNYDDPYSGDFVGGELLDPKAKGVARV